MEAKENRKNSWTALLTPRMLAQGFAQGNALGKSKELKRAKSVTGSMAKLESLLGRRSLRLCIEASLHSFAQLLENRGKSNTMRVKIAGTSTDCSSELASLCVVSRWQRRV